MGYVILDAVEIGSGKRRRRRLGNGAVPELRRFRVRIVGLEEPRHFFLFLLFCVSELFVLFSPAE